MIPDTTSESSRKRHPIQVVVRRTGLTADVLRAWERRYSVVEPGRSEGGRRLYSDDDIERLRLLRRATRGGRRISNVAPLSLEALTALVQEDEREEVKAGPEEGEVAAASTDVHFKACMGAVERMDARELHAALNRALVLFGAPVVIDRIASPLFEHVGELWNRGDVKPAHEHLVSAVIQGLFGGVLEAADPSGVAPGIVVTTPAGQTHEFGALFAAATAASEGWRVTYLGPDLPADDIATAVRTTGADALAMSVVLELKESDLASELRELRLKLPPTVPVLLGGAAVSAYQDVVDEIEAIVVPTMEELRQALASLS
ncbi:MAG: MerR family transcriptional regulator [Gemmatimonadales bacterium]|jgi:DNA-binding transcriptional MerR regulator/methylmalonyl-CoA mutase cobalamin-binding subunit